jgi:signal transduction histidine kinase
MMRSLTLKLTLAFLFVSVVGIGLVALFVRQRTQHEFDRFVLDRFQMDMVEEIGAFYQVNGGWGDLSAIIVRLPGRHAGQVQAGLAALTLADAQGTVIYGSRLYRPGQQLPEEALEVAAPVNVDGDTVGFVLFDATRAAQLALAESPESQFLENLNLAIVFGALGAISIALVLGVVLARTISRPVGEVTAATRIVAGGELGYQVPVRTSDELGQLAASFNQMSTDLAQANELRRQMTADIAHDLRTPLSVILGYLEGFSSNRLEATPEALGIVYGRAQLLQHLVEDLRTLALADAGELGLNRRPVEPRALLEHTALTYMVQAQEAGIALAVEADEGLPATQVDPERMAQVLGNLVSNALRYTPAGGQVTLSARQEAGALVLAVGDTGAGIEATDLPFVFDRFYRGEKSRPQSGESGLGLAIARSIVEAHGGAISVVVSAPGQGTTFTVRLPAGETAEPTKG